MNNACNALQLSSCKKYFWCDSRVILQWITNHDLRMPKFVARCIHVILPTSHTEDWKFCPTDNNPADVATRPLTVKSSIDRMNLWLNGPNIEELITNLAEVLHTHTQQFTKLGWHYISHERSQTFH